MSTSSETDEFGGTTWWVDEDGGRARIDRRTGWDHYLVTCRGVTRLIAGDDFGRAHDAALAAIHATRGEAPPEGDGWEEVEPDVWRWSDGGEYSASVCRVDADLAARHGHGVWVWDARHDRLGRVAEGECHTLDEAKRFAAAQARPVRSTTQPGPAPSERERIAAVERERDELRALLDEINREDTGPGEAYGCGSHSCVVERPQGQGNNGGCRCSRGTLRRALRRERERTAAAVEAERAACELVLRWENNDGYLSAFAGPWRMIATEGSWSLCVVGGERGSRTEVDYGRKSDLRSNRLAAEAALRALGVAFRVEEDGAK